MVNILIFEDDYFLKSGLISLLNVFFNKNNEEINIYSNLEQLSGYHPDIIIANTMQNQLKVCNFKMYENFNGIIIALCSDGGDIRSHYPKCVNHAIFVSKKTNPLAFLDAFSSSWENKNKKNILPYPKCFQCKFKISFGKQTKVAIKLINGELPEHIAYEFSINEKTVLAHKYDLMVKYKIKGTHDFFHIVKEIKKNMNY